MTETQDWNSGQGAYPSDRDTWTLRMEQLPPAGVVPPYEIGVTHDELREVTRHLSTRPTLDEIRSLCDDEMGDTESEVLVSWYLADPNGNETDGRITLRPTGGVV